MELWKIQCLNSPKQVLADCIRFYTVIYFILWNHPFRVQQLYFWRPHNHNIMSKVHAKQNLFLNTISPIHLHMTYQKYAAVSVCRESALCLPFLIFIFCCYEVWLIEGMETSPSFLPASNLFIHLKCWVSWSSTSTDVSFSADSEFIGYFLYSQEDLTAKFLTTRIQGTDTCLGEASWALCWVVASAWCRRL